MSNTKAGRVPKLSPCTTIGPAWWHHHGSKMRVVSFDTEGKMLTIAGSAAYVKIFPFSLESVHQRLWILDWNIAHSQTSQVQGRIVLDDDDELRAMFGLSDETGIFGDVLIEGYKCDSAQQGKWIRWGDFVNTPCPGTASDGDPNVSFRLDNQMKMAVTQLLS